MQGKKERQPKMMYQVSLEELVPENNYYRQTSKELDLNFIYEAAGQYYGKEGQESIDPAVFFKICLAGYLNNINSDRKLIEYCGNCLDIRLFIKYDIDETLPRHSTISRTRRLYGEEVFIELFRKVLPLCVSKGMAGGKRQAIDSVFIKANAGMDSLLEKEVLEDAEKYAEELNENNGYKVTAEKKKEIESRHARQSEKYKQPGGEYKEGKEGNAGDIIQSKYYSNHTHYSPAGPDSGISTKPGKPRNLNYLGQTAADNANHVITGALADYADKRDSRCIKKTCEQVKENLEENNLKLNQAVMDTGYSSGEALKYCEENGIDAYIPNFGKCKQERDGFIYNKELDRYECQCGNKAVLPMRNAEVKNNNSYVKRYISSETDCKDCPLRGKCCGKKMKRKKLDGSIHKEYYGRMHRKLVYCNY